MNKEAQANQIESTLKLRKMLKPGDTVTTILRSVSRSGMARRISCIIARDSEIIDITWDVARAMGNPVKQRGQYVQDSGLFVGGCGMDMGFHVVYSLSRTLFPDGFGIKAETGAHPQTKQEAGDWVSRGVKFYGRNGDTTGWDNDGGYALKQRWL